jgi:hypothetical protein
MRGVVLFVLCVAAFVACGSEPEETVQPQCTPFQFRACLSTSGQQGTQQCLEDGVWAPCIPSVYDDASYAEHAEAETAAEASDDGGQDAEDGSDADADLDGPLDALGDAPEASLLD